MSKRYENIGFVGVLLFVALVFFVLWVVPAIGIWALNGLFHTGIEQNIQNWGYFWLVKLTLTGATAVSRK